MVYRHTVPGREVVIWLGAQTRVQVMTFQVRGVFPSCAVGVQDSMLDSRLRPLYHCPKRHQYLICSHISVEDALHERFLAGYLTSLSHLTRLYRPWGSPSIQLLGHRTSLPFAVLASQAVLQCSVQRMRALQSLQGEAAFPRIHVASSAASRCVIRSMLVLLFLSVGRTR